MALTKNELATLIESVALTREQEANCTECLDQLAEFAELSLAGKSIHEGLQAVEHHLAICNECQEEYQALLNCLKQHED